MLDLARELNVFIVSKESDKVTDVSLEDRILNFKATGPSSFGDAAEWEKQDRADRDLPFK